MKGEKILRKALLNIGKESPFYYYVLLGVKLVPSKNTRNLKLSFSTTGDVMLLYNPEAIERKPLRMLQALLIHEVMHIVLQHFRIKPKDERDRKIWDLAMDAAINQYIPELAAFGIPLDVLVKEGHATDNDTLFVLPPEWMMFENAEAYHKWILEEMERLGRYDVEVVAEFRDNVDDHSGLFEEDVPVEMILDLTKDRTKKAFNLFGDTLPSGVKREVSLSIENPELDWKTLLRRFFGVSIKADRYTTPLRPNRRYDHLPGWRNEYLPRIAAVVDTSGSIVEKELNQFISELEKISNIAGEELWLVQVDKSVTSAMKYRSGKWKDLEIVGGGSTDLQPAIDYSERVLRSEGTVVFTDGHTDVPIARRRILFVLSRYHNEEFLKEARKMYGRDAVVVLS
jgi:predicted metal-dependent peptidase